jgi:hypothetical protein
MAELLQHAPVLLHWRAATQTDHQRSTRWYIVAGVIAGGCIGYGLISGAWSFALVVTLIVGAYAFLHHAPVATAEMVIAEDGLTYNGIFAPWSNVLDFWFIELPGCTELHVMKKTGGIRELSLQTGDIPVPQLRAVLSRFLTERPDQKERLLDRIIRISKL